MSNQLSKKVEVAYASLQVQKLIAVDVALEATDYDAISASKVLEACSEVDLQVNKVGIFGKAIKAPEKHVLRDGDRVEIYRPLVKKSK